MLDIAVIGSGPAGLSAAVNAAVRNRSVTVFARETASGALDRAERVDNYLGFSGISGRELYEQFLNHARELQVAFETHAVTEIYPMGDHYTLNVNNDFVEARAVIIATGVPRKALLPGEDSYVGRGVSYCATCDGPLYRGKTVAMVSELPEGEAEARYLSEICAQVHYIPLYHPVRLAGDNISILNDRPVRIEGEQTVRRLVLREHELCCDGIFLLRKSIPLTRLIAGLELEDGYIRVGRHMETNLPGLYAAGDCTGLPLQLAKAVGEGLIAAQQAVKHIDALNQAAQKHPVLE
ncbi:MAG: NAD(P)/FAD-dependent oxidoreductase [Clostridiales bacterium]|nr:NAD(P)/FAD-dependent oxidoreductase [Clostridiales bacterium]